MKKADLVICEGGFVPCCVLCDVACVVGFLSNVCCMLACIVPAGDTACRVWYTVLCYEFLCFSGYYAVVMMAAAFEDDACHGKPGWFRWRNM